MQNSLRCCRGQGTLQGGLRYMKYVFPCLKINIKCRNLGDLPRTQKMDGQPPANPYLHSMPASGNVITFPTWAPVNQTFSIYRILAQSNAYKIQIIQTLSIYMIFAQSNALKIQIIQTLIIYMIFAQSNAYKIQNHFILADKQN